MSAPLSIHTGHQRGPQQAMAERELSRRTAAEYLPEIFDHVVKMDERTRPLRSMIDLQPEIEWRMWPHLVNFLVEIHSKLRLEPRTLFLAMNIVNRYCSKRIVFRKHFQLVGCTALWIAAKYEDKKSRVPLLSMLGHLCCGAYSEDMFVQMEGHLLVTLEWNISHCTVDTFLSMMLSNAASPLLVNLNSYLAELTLYHRDFVGRDPLLVAKMIHMLAMHILNFCAVLPIQNTSAEELEILDLLCHHIKSPPRVHVAKYSSMDFMQVARLVSSYCARSEDEELEVPGLTPSSATSSPGVYNMPVTPPQAAYSRSALPHKVSATGHGGVFRCAATPANLTTVATASSSTSSLNTQAGLHDDSPMTLNDVETASSKTATVFATSSVTAVNSDCEEGLISKLIDFGTSPPASPLNPPKFPYSRRLSAI